jgi:hypothetical protein
MAGQFIAKRLKLEETLTQRFGFGGASYKNLIQKRPHRLSLSRLSKIAVMVKSLVYLKLPRNHA